MNADKTIFDAIEKRGLKWPNLLFQLTPVKYRKMW